MTASITGAERAGSSVGTSDRRRRSRTTRLPTAAAAGLLAVVGVLAQPAPHDTANAADAEQRVLLGRVPAADPVGATGDDLVNDEVATATLDPTGLAEQAVLISRLTSRGPAQEVLDPASVTNVAYLDRLGRPEVTADGVRVTVGGAHPVVLTRARFDKPLPVAVHVEYALDGSVVPATAVPGAAGELAITYTLTNTTAQDAELTYEDAAGDPTTTTKPVFAPFQGTLTVTLPEGAQLLDGGGAILAADASGRTIAQWNVSLFPPISTPVQQVTLRMRTDRASLPGAEVVLTPAALDQDPATSFSDELLAGVTKGNTELHAGLVTLDEGASGLATGAEQLAQGLGRISAGTGDVAVAGDALSVGLDQVADGSDELATGTKQLADALGTASDGAAQLADATAALADAATAGPTSSALQPLLDAGQQIEAGLVEVTTRVGSAADPTLPATLPPDADAACPPGGTAPPDDDCVTLYQGIRALRDGLVALEGLAAAMTAQVATAQADATKLAADLTSIGTDAASAAVGAGALVASLCVGSPPALDPTSCAALTAVAQKAGAAAATSAGTAPTLTSLLTALGTLTQQAKALTTATAASRAGADRLLVAAAALGESLGQGSTTQPGLTAGMSALNAGLAQLAQTLDAGQSELRAALASVATGSGALASGVAAAADGAGALAEGSDALAAGAQGAATGAGQLAHGLGSLASGSASAAAAGDELATGAAQLQEEGTAPAAQGVVDASTDPALVAAWLSAAGARAADALPYGAPQGWTGHVAYVFTIDEVAAPRSLWDRVRGLFGR